MKYDITHKDQKVGTVTLTTPIVHKLEKLMEQKFESLYHQPFDIAACFVLDKDTAIMNLTSFNIIENPKLDPNELLKTIECSDLRSEEKEACEALYEWIRKGGFDPDWSKYEYGTRIYREWYINTHGMANTPPGINIAQSSSSLKANDVQVGGDYYKKQNIEPWDYIAQNNIGYLEGNAIKYLSRWKDKGGLQDLEKAAHYIAKLIELEKEKCQTT
jgi:hypothetical protein